MPHGSEKGKKGLMRPSKAVTTSSAELMTSIRQTIS
jgi:hypothetical protein